MRGDGARQDAVRSAGCIPVSVEAGTRAMMAD